MSRAKVTLNVSVARVKLKLLKITIQF